MTQESFKEYLCSVTNKFKDIPEKKIKEFLNRIDPSSHLYKQTLYSFISNEGKRLRFSHEEIDQLIKIEKDYDLRKVNRSNFIRNCK